MYETANGTVTAVMRGAYEVRLDNDHLRHAVGQNDRVAVVMMPYDLHRGGIVYRL